MAVLDAGGEHASPSSRYQRLVTHAGAASSRPSRSALRSASGRPVTSPVQPQQVEGDERDRQLGGSLLHRDGMGGCHAAAEGLEVDRAVPAGDQLAVEDRLVAVESVGEAGQLGDAGRHVAPGAGANREASST